MELRNQSMEQLLPDEWQWGALPEESESEALARGSGSSACFESYKQLFDWPALFLDKLSDDQIAELVRKARNGICLVTDYSGLGSPETALHFLFQALGTRLGDPDMPQKLRLMRASDCDVHCRRILLGQPAGVGEPGACCVLGDMLDRCPSELVTECEALLQDCRGQAKEAIETDGLRPEEACRSWGRKFVDQAIQIMSKNSQTKNPWCYRHLQSQCACNSAVPEEMLSMAVAGVTCVDWSAIGLKGGWLGDSAIAFLAWARERHLYQERIILIECTPAIDVATIQEIFFEYTMVVFDICPSMLGIPVHRRRAYMILLRSSDLAWHTDCAQDPATAWRELFCQKTWIDCAEFGSAPTELVEQQARILALARGFPATSASGSAWKPKALLSSAVRDRIRDWEALVRMQLSLQPGQVASRIMNSTQNPERCPITKLCPTLLTKSRLWSMRHQRHLLLAEMCEIQGFACLTSSQYPCPFRAEVLESDLGKKGAIPDGAMRRMIGNGMHMHCIGAMILFALSCTTKVPAVQTQVPVPAAVQIKEEPSESSESESESESALPEPAPTTPPKLGDVAPAAALWNPDLPPPPAPPLKVGLDDLPGLAESELTDRHRRMNERSATASSHDGATTEPEPQLELERARKAPRTEQAQAQASQSQDPRPRRLILR